MRGSFTTDTTNTPTVFHSMGTMPLGASIADVTAILGIAVEPVHVIQGQLASLPASISRTASDPTFLAERVVKHLFNYLSSFATGGTGLSADNYVQLSAIQRWYESFLAKVRAGGIGFLERDEP